MIFYLVALYVAFTFFLALAQHISIESNKEGSALSVYRDIWWQARGQLLPQKRLVPFLPRGIPFFDLIEKVIELNELKTRIYVFPRHSEKWFKIAVEDEIWCAVFSERNQFYLLHGQCPRVYECYLNEEDLCPIILESVDEATSA